MSLTVDGAVFDTVRQIDKNFLAGSTHETCRMPAHIGAHLGREHCHVTSLNLTFAMCTCLKVSTQININFQNYLAK